MGRLNIFKQITFYDKNLTEENLIKYVLDSLKYDIDGIGVFPNYLSVLNSVVPKDVVLSCLIDYPYGLSDSKMRQHQTISAIRRGANCVDLVINPVLLLNGKRDQLLKDIRANKEICDQNLVDIRIMLEYRHFSVETIKEVIQICKISKIKTIFPSTGHFVDDFLDNLIFSEGETKRINVVSNGNLWKREQFDLVGASGIYGVSIKYRSNLGDVFGV